MSDPNMNRPRVAVLVAATQRYTAFIPPILESFGKYFLKDCDVEVIVLTDLPEKVSARTLYIKHEPWPGVAMHKFHYICQYAKELEVFNYIFMCDADMRAVAPVGREILGNLVGTKHPYFFDKGPNDFTYERNPASTAYIAPGEGSVYCQTAFFGGSYAGLMAMAQNRRDAIEADFANNLVAVWHDESHFNRYIYDHPADVLLSPSYCFPEGMKIPFEPKILALDKDHDIVRSTGFGTWLVRGERLAQRVLRKAKSLVGRS